MSTERTLALKIGLTGLAGYLLGSLLPFGYVSYVVRSWITPTATGYDEPAFDRSLLKGAKRVATGELLDSLESNPSFFASQYLDKPVTVVGQIDWFMQDDADQDGATLTLDAGSEYRNIFLSFDNDKDPKLLGLRTGQVVEATCMVTGTTSSAVHMSHCEVQQSREVPK